MKTTPFAIALTVAAALSAPAAHEAQAAYTGIQKCQAPDGTAVYTDKPCAQLDAAPAAMSGELGRRLADESLRAMPDASTLAAGMQPAIVAPTGRRSLSSGCARTPTQLAMDMQASLGLHDVNRLAESYHWAGMSHAQAMSVMEKLGALTRTQVLGAQVHGAAGMGLQFADASGEAMELSTGTLVLNLQADEGPRVVQMNVEHYAGCYFARF